MRAIRSWDDLIQYVPWTRRGTWATWCDTGSDWWWWTRSRGYPTRTWRRRTAGAGTVCRRHPRPRTTRGWTRIWRWAAERGRVPSRWRTPRRRPLQQRDVVNGWRRRWRVYGKAGMGVRIGRPREGDETDVRFSYPSENSNKRRQRKRYVRFYSRSIIDYKIELARGIWSLIPRTPAKHGVPKTSWLKFKQIQNSCLRTTTAPPRILSNNPPIIPLVFRQAICYHPSKKQVLQKFHILQYPYFYIKSRRCNWNKSQKTPTQRLVNYIISIPT